MIHSTWPIYSTISCIHTTCTIKEPSWKVQTILINLCLLSERKIYILKSIILISFYIISYEKDLCYKLSAYLIMTIVVVLHIKYFNLNIIQTWHRITVNISTFFIPFFLKSFLPWRWYDFSLQRYLGSKGKNNFEWSAVSLSLSLSHTHPVTDSSMLVMRVLVSDERRQLFFFFNFYQTRRTHFQGGTRSQRFFFRNGGRHSRFSSAFNVTFDLSYLASHLSYRLETKCILKWKSFVVRRMLQNDTIFQDWYNSASKQVSWNYYFRLEWIL